MSGFGRRLQAAAAGLDQPVVGTTLAQDDFNRADGSLGTATIGGAWSTFGTPTWAITNDTVAVNASGGTDAPAVATVPVAMTSGTIFCDVYLSPTNANTGLCMRASVSGSTYLNVQINESVTYDRVAVSKRVSGSTTWLTEQDNVNLNNGQGYTLAVVLTPTNVTVYVDGAKYLDYPLAAQDITDLTGSTYVGLRSWFGPNDDDGGSRWDRFLVTNSVSAPAPRTPAAPWNVTATSAGSGQTVISWSSAGNGGSALTGYKITSSNGPVFTVSDPTAVSYNATGLSNVAQTFTVQALNAVGYSDAAAPSALSTSVTPNTASVPGAPTGVSAVAGNTQASVSWTAPASNGGSPITGYTVTSSPGSHTATSNGSTSAIVTGLTNGTAYTFTVTATNSAGTGSASSPSGSITPSVPGTVLYGPDGTEWAPNTPTDSSSFDVTVSSLAGLNAALAAVSSGQANGQNYRIGLTDGDYAAGSQAVIVAQSTLTSATGNVLVRAVNPGNVQFTNGILMQCSHLSLAYVNVTGNFKFSGTVFGTYLLRAHLPGAATVTVSSGQSDSNSVLGGGDCGLVGCVFPDNPSNQSDRLHISPNYGGSGHTPGRAMHNFTFTRCWIEGMTYPAGATNHADMLQIDGLTGTLTATNTYFGPAGDNGNPQVKADIFNSAADGDFCSLFYDTCAFAGAYKDGQGNASNQSGPGQWHNSLFYDVSSSLAFRFNTPLSNAYQGSTTPSVLLDSCTFWGTINGSGSGLTNTNATFHAAQHPCPDTPTLVKPAWAWW